MENHRGTVRFSGHPRFFVAFGVKKKGKKEKKRKKKRKNKKGERKKNPRSTSGTPIESAWN